MNMDTKTAIKVALGGFIAGISASPTLNNYTAAAFLLAVGSAIFMLEVGIVYGKQQGRVETAEKKSKDCCGG